MEYTLKRSLKKVVYLVALCLVMPWALAERIARRFLGRDVGDTDEPDTLRATVERCDTCRKYADDHEASHAAEQKMRLYDEIMAERPPKEDT